MLRELGLPQSALHGDLDRLYIEKVLQDVRDSSLSYAVLLAHEEPYQEDGTRIEGFGSMYVPNDYVLNLAQQHPEFLAGVSIHPARPDALDELERCLDAGAALLKLLPNCQNVDCSDRRYTKFWERMAEARLPLLAHTGGELALPIYDAEYADPLYLSLPLECGVTVIAAHCGTSSLYWDRDYTEHFAAMLERYPNLYGDVSGMFTPFRSRHLRKVLQEPILSRLVHGSDVPIPISGTWPWLRGLIPASVWRECRALENVLERDFRLKAALGIPEEAFTRPATLLRLPE